MLTILSRCAPHFNGGLEKFNEVMCQAFKNENISFDLIKYPFKGYYGIIHYYLTIIIIALKNKNKGRILVQYGSFVDLIALIVIRLFYKKIYIIAHIGPMWLHLNNRLLRFVSINIIRMTVKKTLVISKEQERIFGNKIEILKIDTIIDNKFFVEKKSTNQFYNNYFLYYGRISPDKGIINLINAFKIISKNESKLVIAGDYINNNFKQEVENCIKNNDLDSKIIFTGYISSTIKLIELIDHSNAIIYPSFYDAFPLVMIETFARGKPCLTSNISESINFIENNDLLFNPNSQNELIAKWRKLFFTKYDSNKLKNRSTRYEPINLVIFLKKNKIII